MLTSKERSELRAQANSIETTLIVGKEGVTETVIAEAENQLTARELIKGKVLETALMSAREVSDEICQATGADGVSCVGYKFVASAKSARKSGIRPAGQSGNPPRFLRQIRCERAPRLAARQPRPSVSSVMSISARRPLTRPLSAGEKSSCGAKSDYYPESQLN